MGWGGMGRGGSRENGCDGGGEGRRVKRGVEGAERGWERG